MDLTLTEAEAAELTELVNSALNDLHYEIAATDNASYRAQLTARRARLDEIADILRAASIGG